MAETDERLWQALDAFFTDEMEEAQAIMRQHGFVIDVNLSKPVAELTEVERWQKLTFTLYTMLTPSGDRIRKAYDAIRPALE